MSGASPGRTVSGFEKRRPPATVIAVFS